MDINQLPNNTFNSYIKEKNEMKEVYSISQQIFQKYDSIFNLDKESDTKKFLVIISKNKTSQFLDLFFSFIYNLK